MQIYSNCIPKYASQSIMPYKNDIGIIDLASRSQNIKNDLDSKTG